MVVAGGACREGAEGCLILAKISGRGVGVAHASFSGLGEAQRGTTKMSRIGTVGRAGEAVTLLLQVSGLAADGDEACGGLRGLAVDGDEASGGVCGEGSTAAHGGSGNCDISCGAETLEACPTIRKFTLRLAPHGSDGGRGMATRCAWLGALAEAT